MYYPIYSLFNKNMTDITVDIAFMSYCGLADYVTVFVVSYCLFTLLIYKYLRLFSVAISCNIFGLFFFIIYLNINKFRK